MDGHFCIEKASSFIEKNLKRVGTFLMTNVVDSVKHLSALYEQEEGFDSQLKAINNPFNEEVKDIFLINVMKTSISQSEKVECGICVKKVALNRMRQHIGFHIIKGDILPEPTTCGFCGLIGCHISMKKAISLNQSIKVFMYNS